MINAVPLTNSLAGMGRELILNREHISICHKFKLSFALLPFCFFVSSPIPPEQAKALFSYDVTEAQCWPSEAFQPNFLPF